MHPGHVRKMVVALLKEAGPERAPKVLYWENTEGRHGGAANNRLKKMFPTKKKIEKGLSPEKKARLRAHALSTVGP